MNDKLKKIIEPLHGFWGKLNKKTKIVIFICLGAAIALSVILSSVMNRTQYSVLYSGLGSDEAQEVTNQLRTMDVAYKNENGTIYIDKNKENTVRMQLANQGYPKTGPNYDFFTSHVGNMTTDEERKIIEQYQLQDRLSSVIKTLGPVDTAYVTISLPNSNTYAWDDSSTSAASASVAIKLKGGQTLDSKQVNGIKQLVSKSVPNLKANNVTIVDSSTGEELAGSSSSSGSDGSTQITLSEFKLKIENQYENNLQNKIKNLLSRAYGANNISVNVKSKMDLDKKIQDIVTYTPSTSNGKGIVSHSEETNEVTRDGTSSGGGVAGTQSNSDTTTYPGVTVSGNVITAKDSRTYDYLVNKVQEQVQSDAASLDDLTVAVVVTTGNMADANKQELVSLVANAAAVDPSKVAIMTVAPSSLAASAPAVQAGAFQQLLKNPVILIAGGALILLIILLIVLSASRRKRARQEELMENLQPEGVMPPEAESVQNPEEPAAPPQSEPSIEEQRNEGSSKQDQVKNQLQDFSSKNPEIAAQLIRSWLKGDDGKHG